MSFYIVENTGVQFKEKTNYCIFFDSDLFCIDLIIFYTNFTSLTIWVIIYYISNINHFTKCYY